MVVAAGAGVELDVLDGCWEEVLDCCFSLLGAMGAWLDG